MSESEVQLEQPFISHLLELRDRLLRVIVVVLVIFLGLFPFGNDIYVFVAKPLMAALPEGNRMIATQVASPFLTPFKLALVSAVFLSMPLILYQMWAFVAPGLYRHERKMVVPLLISSILLFYLGMAFAYFVVFPLVFSFLTGVTPEGVDMMTDITAYLDFVLTLFFAFGFAFEVPIATILLVWMGATTPQSLAEKRPYIIVGAFIIGMLLTPPDVISQTLLALPMWVLFELGVIFSKGFVRKGDEEEEAADEFVPSSTPAPATAAGGGATAAERLDIAPPSDYVPPTDEEMEAELDRIEAEEKAEEASAQEAAESAGKPAQPENFGNPFPSNAGEDPEWEALNADEDEEDWDLAEVTAAVNTDPIDAKLAMVNELREQMDFAGARRLLYEVLVEGSEAQVTVAKNVLAQLDEE